MTEYAQPANEVHAAGLAGWWVNPDRTLVAVRQAGPGGRLDCLRFDPAGVASPCWTLAEPADWEVLGWAATGLLALWRRRAGGSELRIVDVFDAMSPPVQHLLVGRPVACRVGGTRRLVVLVVMARGGRPQAWLQVPQTGTCQPLPVSSPFQGMGAWGDDGRVLAVNIDAEDGAPGVAVFCDLGSGPVQVDVAWPSGVRPVRAAGWGAGRVGLTGVDSAGEPVPGVWDTATGMVRWFGAQAGYSCVDVARSGGRILAATRNGESFGYRAIDGFGRRIGEFGAGAAVVTDPCFAADEAHAVGLRQSPAAPSSVWSWNVRTGVAWPMQPHAAALDIAMCVNM